ncbi:MAG TPA: hypothetical protein VKN76_00615 [Kiloniellaceae bacterium]|nr:hypothetical protein [Kiloniellaceae bacterium]
MSKTLLENWQAISKQLGFEIEAPYALTLKDGSTLSVPFLVKGFGGPKGTIVVTDFGLVRACANQLVARGYGVSTLSEPEIEASYSVEGCIRVLSDWGWCGDPELAPDWILPEEDLD